MTRLAAALLALVLSSCQRPVAPPPPDASAALAPSPPTVGTGPCDMACADMAAVGCAEGASPYCPGNMAKIEGLRITAATECRPDAGAAGCFVTCDWCRTAKTSAEVVARCGSSCSASGTGR